MNRLKPVFWGLVFVVCGFLFWQYLVGNPINELALIQRGITTKGVITDVREDVGVILTAHTKDRAFALNSEPQKAGQLCNYLQM